MKITPAGLWAASREAPCWRPCPFSSPPCPSPCPWSCRWPWPSERIAWPRRPGWDILKGVDRDFWGTCHGILMRFHVILCWLHEISGDLIEPYGISLEFADFIGFYVDWIGASWDITNKSGSFDKRTWKARRKMHRNTWSTHDGSNGGLAAKMEGLKWLKPSRSNMWIEFKPTTTQMRLAKE